MRLYRIEKKDLILYETSKTKKSLMDKYKLSKYKITDITDIHITNNLRIKDIVYIHSVLRNRDVEQSTVELIKGLLFQHIEKRGGFHR